MKENGNRERKEGSQERGQVLDGNAFYEIDLECVREKERKKQSGRTEKMRDSKQ